MFEHIKYANFHSHDGYSYLDGTGNAKQYMAKAQDKNLYCQGISNHGVTSSVLEWYDTAKKMDYRTTLGQEFYVEADEVIFAPQEERKNLNKYYHLILIAKNRKGYQNLMALSSLGFDEKRFYTRPRVSFKDIFEHREGLICTSGCVIGPIAKNILDGNLDKAYNYAKLFQAMFGEDFFLEIEAADLSMQWDRGNRCFYQSQTNMQDDCNRTMVKLGKFLNIPIVLGQDSHLVDIKDKTVQDITMQTRPGADGWHFYNAYYVRSVPEMWEDCQKYHPYITEELFVKMCDATVEIADRCKNLELVFKPQLPKVEDSSLEKLFKIIIQKGKIPNSPIYMNRLKYEIDVIHRNGKIDLLPYFFVLEDLVSWCAKNDVVTGPGRGSAAGSLLAYALGITTIDPIKYDLLFERFLSLARIEDGTLPDIDIDFSDNEKVKEYLRSKYGDDKVFSMGTVHQIKIKVAWSDICRVILADEIRDNNKETMVMIKSFAKGLPSTLPDANLPLIIQGTYQGHLVDNKMNETEEDKKILEAIANGVSNDKDFVPEMNIKWRQWIDTHPKGKKIWDVMQNILGLPRQASVHASAVAISSEPITNIVSTFLSGKNKVPATQFTAKWCEYAGIIKFDILGLKTLKDFQECLRLIKERCNKVIDIYNLPLNDQRVYDAFNQGDTDTVFQFNTSLQKHIVMEMRVRDLLDLAVVTAVARPGPLSSGVKDAYIKNRKNPFQIAYDHPYLKEITEKYYGTFIFQENIMQVFSKIGGATLAEAESIRRAMSKHKIEIMKAYEEKFIKYSTTQLQPPLTQFQATELWEKLRHFSSYSFNLSHAVCYAYIAYACQWFKVNFPLEWWCAVLKNCSDKDLKEFYGHLPVPLILPRINFSKETFYVYNDESIVMPLSVIKQVGENSLIQILKHYPYTSFDDFFTRVNKVTVKKNVIINLIFAGVFDEFEPDREALLKHFFKLRKKNEEIPKEYTNLDRTKLSDLESDTLAFKSVDYFGLYPDHFPDSIFKTFLEIREVEDGHRVGTGGKVVKKEIKKTKAGKKYCELNLYNNGDEIKAKFWDDLLPEIKKDDVVRLFADTNHYQGTVSLNGKKIEIIDFTNNKEK